MKKKIISGSLVALMALGLAGCANNSAAPSSKVNHPQTTKLAQSSSKKAANSSSAKAASENRAVQPSGVDNARGTQYMISPANAQGEYQVEVRDSNGDPNISHLDGMYKFNPATNQVQKANRVTGEYEK